MKPIRVMNIIARLNVGGPAIHVSLLTANLGAPKYESVLVCGNIEATEGDMSYIASAKGVQPIYIPELGRSLNPLRDVTTVWKLYRLIRQWKPDVVHTHTSKAGFVGRIAAWLAGVPVIVHTFHGHVFHGYFSPAKTRFFILIEQFTARLSDTIIANTDGLRDELANIYHITSADHIFISPLAVDLEPFMKMPRKQGTFRRAWNIPLDVPLVGIVGRLVPIKNHRLFLEAAAQIRQEMANAHFVIIGDGELRAELEALVDELKLRDAVTFTGWVKEVAPIYSDLDVSVISSNNEGVPGSITEALVARCPVVSTSVGGVPEMLEHGAVGSLVKAGDRDGLAQAIISTLRNPPNGDKGRAAALHRSGLEVILGQLDALYTQHLTRKGRLSAE
ncbi:MAG: glycosyltransferase family 4 protein [Anaerolineae bacterium]